MVSRQVPSGEGTKETARCGLEGGLGGQAEASRESGKWGSDGSVAEIGLG